MEPAVERFPKLSNTEKGQGVDGEEEIERTMCCLAKVKNH
jgi:hypothetical protein